MSKPDPVQDRQSLQRQLDEERENLRIIEERIAQYVMKTDVPLQLTRDERQVRARIAVLERALEAISPASRASAPGAGSQSGGEQPPSGSSTWLRRLMLIGALGAVAVIVLLWLFQPKNPCDSAPVDYDFETGSNEGWDVRYEGERKLGLDAQPASVQHCGAGSYALAFRFAQTADRPTAQVKLETAHLRVNDRLSAWVYAPLDLPADMQASCFILEDNTTNRWVDKPQWPWYQTGNRSIKPGEWTLVECRAADFAAKEFAGARWDDPLLAGLEFTRANGEPMEGTLYLDKIIVR